MKTFKKLAAIMMSIVFVMMYYTPASAAGLATVASVSLSEPIAGTGSSYVFSMKSATGSKVPKGIKMSWRTTASNGAQQPTSGAWNNATYAAGTANAGIRGDALDAAVALDKTDEATGTLYLTIGTRTTEMAANTTIGWTVSGITNASVAAPPVGCTPNPTNNSSGTCFIRVQIYDTDTIATMQSETAGNIIDTVTLGYAVNAGADVTAKVDPALTFTVVGVDASSVANGQTTAARTEFNLLPFGNLGVDTPKYLAQDIYTKTNANNGYTVTAKMVTQMHSAFGNDIDPFVADKDAPITWGAPAAWATPDGVVANTDTGWIGMNTNNGSNIAGWAAPAGVWGPLQTAQANAVRTSLTPDTGVGATRITFALAANVYQPADAYAGVLEYNCTPIY